MHDRCAVGDYSGRFGELNGSGKQEVVENSTNVTLSDFIGLIFIISGGGIEGCGIIVPEYGEINV